MTLRLQRALHPPTEPLFTLNFAYCIVSEILTKHHSNGLIFPARICKILKWQIRILLRINPLLNLNNLFINVHYCNHYLLLLQGGEGCHLYEKKLPGLAAAFQDNKILYFRLAGKHIYHVCIYVIYLGLHLI